MGQPHEAAVLAADRFKMGCFLEAEELFRASLQSDPDNVQTLSRLGRLALLGNRLEDAQQWLDRALAIKQRQSWSQRTLAQAMQRLRGAAEQTPEALLGQVFYLRDDYRQASPLLQRAGWTAQARKLASFGDVQPYQTPDQFAAVHVEFIRTDPLPVIQVRINGGEPVNFVIDTGGAEIILDTEFAAEIGVAQFGGERGVFGGGKTASIQHGRIDSLTLGDLTVEHIPVTMMNVRCFSEPVFEGLRVDGILGTFFLYHFLATLDYPAGQLILRPKTDQNREQLRHVTTGQSVTEVPFWMANHYMVSWGTVNGSRPLLFFVDTGLAGSAFTCPASTVKEASIQLRHDLATDGIGGGGKMSIIPIELNELTLGNARERNLHGAMGAFPPQLEYAFGFHIGGLISHDFFRPYALTLDFANMRYVLDRKG